MTDARPQYAYLHIANDLLDRMRDGQWGPGDRLPAIGELEKQYPQSRMTLYRALKHLADHGHVTMAQGKGTFVREVERRPRVAMLGGTQLFQQSLTPFMLRAFHHAHSALSAHGVDSQLYAEDPIDASRMPPGLLQELAGDKLAGLITIDASFPARHMLTDGWLQHAVPHVHVGAIEAPHQYYVDRAAFLRQAVALAASRGRRRIALIEKREHLVEHRPLFQTLCRRASVEAVVLPDDAMPPAELSFEAYGFELMKIIHTLGLKPDAMVIPDDVIAKGVSQAALALGVMSPETCLLIALTNRGSHLFYPVPITCLEVDVENIVTRAVDRLLAMMHGETCPAEQLLLPPDAHPVENGPFAEPAQPAPLDSSAITAALSSPNAS